LSVRPMPKKPTRMIKIPSGKNRLKVVLFIRLVFLL
jgi:hypothetical protein